MLFSKGFKPVTLAIFSTLFSVICLAQHGNSNGGGGDVRCAEYTDLVGTIASTLATIGQESVSKKNAVINVNELWNIKQHPLRCIPVQSLDRQARSYPNSFKTELLVTAAGWGSMNPAQKLRLAAHELCVLARYETDGEYFISKTIVALVTAASPELNFLAMGDYAEQVVTDSSGAVTFVKPKMNEVHVGFTTTPDPLKHYSGHVSGEAECRAHGAAVGFCKFLGFKDVRITQASYVDSNDSAPGDVTTKMAVFDFEGHYLGLFDGYANDGFYGHFQFSNISCVR